MTPSVLHESREETEMRRNIEIAIVAILLVLVGVSAVFYERYYYTHSIPIGEILANPASFDNTLVRLHGTMTMVAFQFGVPILLKDATGTISLTFPQQLDPTPYLFSEVTIEGKVHHQPGILDAPQVYVEVTLIQGPRIYLEIEWKRTGGFAGASDSLKIGVDNTAYYSSKFHAGKTFKVDLTPQQIREIKRIIIGDNFTTISPESYRAKPGAADYFAYELTVTIPREAGVRTTKTVVWVDEWAFEAQLPDQLITIQRGIEVLVNQIVETVAGSIGQEEAVAIAMALIRNTSTFKFDGLDEGFEVIETQKIVNEPPPYGYSWIVRIEFYTAHPAHGDRTGQILLQVIAKHEAIVTVEQRGEIISAICDGIWDLLADKELPQPATKPTRFTAVVNEGRVLDIVVDVDISDGVSEEEAREIAETTFLTVMGNTAHRLDSLIVEGQLIKAYFTWGVNEEDLGHIFDMAVELTSLTIIVTHCK